MIRISSFSKRRNLSVEEFYCTREVESVEIKCGHAMCLVEKEEELQIK